LKRSGCIWGWRPNANGRSAIARTTPVLLALFSLVTVLALRLSQDGQIPVPMTAWYRKAEPTFTDCLVLVRRHLWRARYLVNSVAEAKCVQFPREAFELLINGFPLAASLAKVEGRVADIEQTSPSEEKGVKRQYAAFPWLMISTECPVDYETRLFCKRS
jgi:hypothetical protein